MSTVFEKVPIGILNPIGLNTNTILFDTRQDSSVNHLRKVMREVSNPNTFDNSSGFIGTVLYVNPNQADSVEKSPGTNIGLIESATDNTNLNLVQIIVRVPELHAFIPEPKDDSDLKNIIQHPIFTAINDSIPIPKVGDLVVVDFKNKINRTDGIYITKIKDSKPGNGSAGTSVSAQNVINNNAQPYTPAKGAKLNYEINTVPPPQVTGFGVTINGAFIQAPPGINVVPFNSPDGFPDSSNTGKRKIVPFQFILHRGSETTRLTGRAKWVRQTLKQLNHDSHATTFTMDLDGTIYQHFDPALYTPSATYGQNAQSDSLDVAGPWSLEHQEYLGSEPNEKQTIMDIKIGKMYKKYSLSVGQTRNLASFLNWYLPLRGIEKRVCSDFKSRGTLHNPNDPVYGVKGLLGHVQVANPGKRGDGATEIACILPYLEGFQVRTDLFA